MAAAALGELEELRELVAVLAGALFDVLAEVDAAGEVPIPDELYEKVREREAFVATFKRLPEDGDVRGKLRTIFGQEMKNAACERESIDGLELDVFSGEDALELLRRRCLLDSELRLMVLRDAGRALV